MAPNSFARKLGIGVRVASQILRERAESVQTAPRGASLTSSPPIHTPNSSETKQRTHSVPTCSQAHIAEKTRGAARKTRNVGRASRRFGEAIWGPFAQVSRVLWLEVTGLFFGIFALFFAQNVYRLRHQFVTGQEHTKLFIYFALTVVFVYFTFTSFYRARRKSRRT